MCHFRRHGSFGDEGSEIVGVPGAERSDTHGRAVAVGALPVEQARSQLLPVAAVADQAQHPVGGGPVAAVEVMPLGEAGGQRVGVDVTVSVQDVIDRSGPGRWRTGRGSPPRRRPSPVDPSWLDEATAGRAKLTDRVNDQAGPGGANARKAADTLSRRFAEVALACREREGPGMDSPRRCAGLGSVRGKQGTRPAGKSGGAARNPPSS